MITVFAQFKSSKLPGRQRSEFTRQLATLLQANIQLLPALKILLQGENQTILKIVIKQLIQEISAGAALSQALQKFPQYFDNLYCHLVQAGERAAALSSVFEQLAVYQEKNLALQSKLRKALLYPTVVFCVACIITVGLLLFIVPQFEQLFQSFGATLPFVTRMVMHSAKFLQTKGLILLAFMFFGMGSIVMIYQRNKIFAARLQKYFLKMPLLGKLQRQAIHARIARTLAITYSAGVPLIEALKIAANVAAQHQYTQALLQARESVIRGETLSAALAKTQLFTGLFIQIIKVGEEAGALAHMLNKAASTDEAQIDHAVAQFSSLLEPFIMVLLGLLIGGLVIAMYLPVFKLGSVV